MKLKPPHAACPTHLTIPIHISPIRLSDFMAPNLSTNTWCTVPTRAPDLKGTGTDEPHYLHLPRSSNVTKDCRGQSSPCPKQMPSVRCAGRDRERNLINQNSINTKKVMWEVNKYPILATLCHAALTPASGCISSALNGVMSTVTPEAVTPFRSIGLCAHGVVKYFM